LEPANSEPCISSLLSFFDPLRSDDSKYKLKLDAMDFVKRYIESPAQLTQLAEAVASAHADKGFTKKGLEEQIAWKAAVIGAVESFLISQWDASDIPMTAEHVTILVQGTLAHFLADADTKARIVELFNILADNVRQKVTDAGRRKVYGRTLYGLNASQDIERWVKSNLAELIAIPTPAELLKPLWALLTAYVQNNSFGKCSKPEALEGLASAWISGQAFNVIFQSLKAQDARLVWGKTFRGYTIDHVVDMCENALAYDASLLLGAVTELAVYIDPQGTKELAARLQALQKMLKYGLPTSASIALYELGFADRALVTEISSSLSLSDEQRGGTLQKLREGRDAVRSILVKYPSYFTRVANDVL
ncbi:MAG: hypothetical protein WCC92_04680, partial [Candidatus Korobacteraceae bacterium]